MYANQCFENSRSHISPFWSGWLTQTQLGSAKGLLWNKQEVILSSCLLRFLYKARDIVLHCFISVRDRAAVSSILPRLHHDQAGPRSHMRVRATSWLQPDHRYVKQKQSRPREGRDNVRLQWNFALKRSSNTGKELCLDCSLLIFASLYFVFILSPVFHGLLHIFWLFHAKRSWFERRWRIPEGNCPSAKGPHFGPVQTGANTCPVWITKQDTISRSNETKSKYDSAVSQKLLANHYFY